MKLARRVRHLERLEALARPSSPMERFQRALNEAAVRLTGKSTDLFAGDGPALELVMDDLQDSFAGEQRREAEEIANRLRADGVTVFYDAYEQADLWGKNLYDHLATVYQHKARYCLMLVSAAYAAKVWTTHERQSAQARTLTQNTEYILPVRIDDTDVPGLLDTIGYVRFADYGVRGIADLLIQKLGSSAPPQAALASVSTSSRACILDAHQDLQAWVPVMRCTWGNTEATLVLQPDDPTDGPFLEVLRSSKQQLLIALKHNVGLCRVTEVQHEFEAGRDQWVVHLRIEQSDFTPSMEMGMNNLRAGARTSTH